MAGRKKGTPLEEEVLDSCLSSHDGEFRFGLLSEEEVRQVAEKERPELDRLLGLAYVDNEWKVGAWVATVLSGQRRFNAIFLGDFGRAREEIGRCLRHPGPFDRWDQAELPIIYHVHGVFGDDPIAAAEAAETLERHIDCGVYSRQSMARQIAMETAMHLHAIHGPELTTVHAPVTDQLKSLVRTIVATKKCRSQIVKACNDINSWHDVSIVIKGYANIRW